MIMCDRLGDVDAHSATIRVQAVRLAVEHQAIIREVVAAGDFWAGAGSMSGQQFITELDRNFRVIYEQAKACGSKVQTEGANTARTESRHPQACSTPPGVRS